MFGNSTRLLLSIVAITSTWLTLSVNPALQAQETNRKKFAITDIEKVDRDFSFAGEYQGNITTGDGQTKQIGLQVSSLGDGKFGGMVYAGGLPGTGWNRKERAKVEGARSGDLVELTTSEYRFEMVNGGPTVFLNGRIVGELDKVYRQSPTMGMKAPANAYTMFDGDNTRQFVNGKMTDDGLLIEGTEFVSRFKDFTLHIEYRLPYMPYARGQDRGNSGLYLQSSYEVQMLDSFGLEGIENECGALYRYKRPDINMCLPPLTWQTYDLTFRSPKFNADGEKIRNARITVLHNGVAVHNDFEIERKTGAGKPESDSWRPIKLQNHSNPVRYRNIWLIDLARN